MNKKLDQTEKGSTYIRTKMYHLKNHATLDILFSIYKFMSYEYL